MLRQTPKGVVATVFALMVMTSILHIGSLLNIYTSKEKSFPSTQRLTWDRHAQVALSFSNDGSHITSDEDWDRLQAKVIKINPRSNDTYIVSMQQQLHCLNIIRLAYLSYHDAESRPPLDSTTYEDAEICIEQIRQHLMCNTDTTLEPTELSMGSNGKLVPGSTGIGVVHRCRDWTQLEQAVLSNTLPVRYPS